MGRPIRVVALALAAVMGLQGVIPPGPATAATDLLPDLRMANLRDFTIETTSSGTRRLRFTAIMVNVGAGPFEVRGRRGSTGDPVMRTRQIIYDSDGGRRAVKSNAVMRFAGDGHDHWHVQRIMRYRLWPVDGSALRRGTKVGFCFFDTTPHDLSLPGAPRMGYYKEAWCGGKSVLNNRVGVSVGWGDSYPWHFAFQWIDITGLPGGDYYVRAIVDPQDFYLEERETNNCSWAKVRFGASGSSVTVLDKGRSGCPAPPVAVKTFPGATVFDPPREMRFARGQHTGHRFDRDGNVIETLTGSIASARIFHAKRRAEVPGHDGKWLYIIDGRWSGYWVRKSSRVTYLP